jgi:MraZ protein
MAGTEPFILGEFTRRLDDRHRLVIPSELCDQLLGNSAEGILAKERPGCLSLWSAQTWQAKWDSGVELVKQKMRAGRLENQISRVQRFGRLLSTRHTMVQLAKGGRLLIPDGFREFLGVEPNGDAMIVGAAVSIEVWNPAVWTAYLKRQIPRFRRLFDQLSG